MNENPNGDGPFYLDDLHVGQHFVSGTYCMSEDRIKDFAREYDPQPFHIDSEAAKETLFGGIAASGWHTAAVTMKLLTAEPPFVGGLIGAGGDITWPRPTRPGDILQVTSEITEITASRTNPQRGRIILRAETRNQRDELVQVLTARLVVPRRSETCSGTTMERRLDKAGN